MRKTISYIKQQITVKQITGKTMLKKYRAAYEQLQSDLVRDGYSWAKYPEECNFYIVTPSTSMDDMDFGIGIGPYLGEYCATNIPSLDGFYLDAKNVIFKPL